MNDVVWSANLVEIADSTVMLFPTCF